MKFRKSTAIVLGSVLLTGGLLAGCSDNTKDTNTSDDTNSAAANTQQNTETDAAAAPKVNMFGWAVPEKTITIDYYSADKDNPDKAAKKLVAMHDYLLENFNVDVKKTQYDVDGKEKLNLMLASSDYPGVMSSIDSESLDKWRSQGKLIDLAPLVDKYGPNIKKELGAKYGSYLDKDGKLWGIPRGWGYLPIPDFSAHIRWDWYQAMGSPKIETPDDYYNVLKQMVAEHPKNAQGEKTYAISWNDQVGINNVMGIWGLKDGYKDDASHNLTHWLNTSEGLEAVKYYNRFFREGLMDPDSFLNKFDDWKLKFSNERILGHIGTWWQSWNAGHEVWKTTMQGWTDEQRYVQISLKAPEAEAAYLSPKDTTGWNYTVITDKEEHPEDIIKFLDFEMTPIGTRLLGWGIPNTPDSVWNYEEGGKWSFNDKQKQELFSGTLDFEKEDEVTGWNQIWLAHPQGLMSDDNKSTAWYDQNFNMEDKWKALMNTNLKDTIYDNTARRVVFSVDNPLTIVNQQIEDLIKTGFAKAVMSKSEQDAVNAFNDMRDKAEKLGLKDIEAFRTKEYQSNLAKMQ
ncbi:sugar ABC transporter substrate-binding protein [Paenibacillus sp. CF384]|uniref:sugar ABC transporter substrate-binding protein n=1 Tax=Paenibacillus sp. CF384 TaxID=1884382 RepID=UPI00089475B9|nr:sugar ABC transporter substrate-binding protein [Paenibacillus sp. CF384]SDX95380.1 ABC-type glycerol-3-phosphate transport system, substrate-binding protein [Paenibacillus sp. CF384]